MTSAPHDGYGERFRVLLLTEHLLVLGKRSSRRSAAEDAGRRAAMAAMRSGQVVLEVVSVEATPYPPCVIEGDDESNTDTDDPGTAGAD